MIASRVPFAGWRSRLAVFACAILVTGAGIARAADDDDDKDADAKGASH